MDWTSVCMALWLSCQDPSCNPANCETYTLNSCELYYPANEPPPPEPEPEPDCKGGPKKCGGDSGGGGKDNPNKGGGKKNG